MFLIDLARRNCKLSKTGVEYVGLISKAAEGEECAYWNNTDLSSNQLSLLNNADQVPYGNKKSIKGNECRNFNNDPRGPWCYNKQLQPIHCDIPFCGTLVF